MLSSQRLWPRLWSNSVAFIVSPFSPEKKSGRSVTFYVVHVVPQPDRRFRNVVLVTQCTKARCAEQEVSAGCGRESEPPHRQYPQEMSAGKQQDIPLHRAHAAQHAIGALAHLFRRFSPWASVAENLPVRTLRVDFLAGQALVFAIVPFHQVGIRLGDSAKPGQFGGTGSALQWTRKHLGNRKACQPIPKLPSVLFATFGQWEVGQSRMLARHCPRSLGVPRQVDRRKRRVHLPACDGGYRSK